MQPLLHENKHTLKLAFPIIVSHLGQMLLGLTDTVMIGRVGTVELAAVSLMNTMIHMVLVLGIGLAVAVSIQISHAHGSGEPDRKRIILLHGACLSFFLGLLVWAGMIFSLPYLDLLKQPQEVLNIFPRYLNWIAPSMALMMPIMVFKSFAEAHNRPWVVFSIQIAGVLLNIVLNALLIFGMLGVPALGLAGAGLATFLSRFITLLAMLVLLNQRFSEAGFGKIRLHWQEFKSLIQLATPITAQMLMEFGAFAMSALLIGQLGSLPMAAHQIALTCAATTYMIPMGLSQAVGIRVGHALGANAIDRCRHIVLGAQALTVLMMGSFAVIYLTQGQSLARAFTPDPELIALSVSLLSITGIFQLFDGVQVVSVSALRAMKDIKIPTLLSFIGYWIVAFPFGVWLGFGLNRGVTGFWIGLATGLGIAALSMSLRLICLLRKGSMNPS